MTLRLFLICAPLAVVAALLQSVLWVPTYDRQSGGNPARAFKFIEPSIGDARLLNPILNSDTASSRVTGLVFDGLIDLDEDLRLRGRLATGWTVSEHAYLVVDPSSTFPDGAPVTARRLLERVRGYVAGDATLARLVRDVALLPAAIRTETVALTGDEEPAQATLEISVPARLQFVLGEVDQDFFDRLDPVLGPDYASDFEAAVRTDPPSAAGRLAEPPAGLPAARRHEPRILFELREDVTFHDGHPFDAGDVKFTYDALMNPRNLSPRTSDFEPVERVEVLDEHRVLVVYKRLFSPAINAWTIGILPEHLLGAAAMQAEMDDRGLSPAAREAFGMRDSRFNRHPVGTGAFRFVEWRSDELIHLARNAAYWDGPPEYRDFYFRVIPDALTQEVEFRSGAVDVYAPLPHQAARYRADPRYQAFSTLGFAYTYIGYNMRRPLFADARVRRALGMAIDVDEIIRYVLYGQGERTTGPYPANTPWYDHDVAPLPYDPAAAERILADLGWRRNADGWLEKDGRIFEFNLITNHGNSLRKSILAIAQNAWRRIGVRCNTQLFEWAVFLQDFINPGEFDAVVLGWSMGIDPDLFQLWHSSQSGPNQLNFVGYRSAAADRIIERLRREYRPQRQRSLAHDLHRTIAADQPYTFLYAPRSTRVLDRKIVMLAADGTPEPVRPAHSGDLYFHLNRWRKLERAPDFSTGP